MPQMTPAEIPNMLLVRFEIQMLEARYVIACAERELHFSQDNYQKKKSDAE
jgi:hypothetical protein